MVAPVIGLAGLSLFTSITFPHSLIVIVVWTTGCWLAVTWLTPAEPSATLVAFYKRVRPGGPGWTRVASLAGMAPPAPIGGQLFDWATGVVRVYTTLFGTGAARLHGPWEAAPWLAVAIASGAMLYRRLTRQGWATITE